MTLAMKMDCSLPSLANAVASTSNITLVVALLSALKVVSSVVSTLSVAGLRISRRAFPWMLLVDVLKMRAVMQALSP